MMENALEINGLYKHYDGFALQDVSFMLPRGVVMGFIGENGAGKTTTIKAVLNLIRRDAGAIKVLGLDNIAGCADGQGLSKLAVRAVLPLYGTLWDRP